MGRQDREVHVAKLGQWRSGEVVAWTERDGVGPPPKAPGRWLALTLAGSLGVVFVSMMSTDTLCAEHRGWVLALGTVGIVLTAVAVVGLVQGWAASPLLTLLVSIDGVAIGLIDATHDPTRGRLIAFGFAVSVVLASLLAAGSLRLSAWDRRVRRQLAPIPVDGVAVTAEHVAPAAGATPPVVSTARAPATVPVDSDDDTSVAALE